jgi:cytochrome P450/NADPH-cytochrome P450 reductase
MTDFLKESFVRITRPALLQALKIGSTAKYQDDIKLMTDLASQSMFNIYTTHLTDTADRFYLVVAQRKAHPTDKRDLLNAMLNGRDPKTGQGLSDENITYNVGILCLLLLIKLTS